LNTYTSPTEADASSLFHQASSDENCSVVLGNAVQTIKYSALGCGDSHHIDTPADGFPVQITCWAAALEPLDHCILVAHFQPEYTAPYLCT
jgi:hypothetical protein